ncbi:uncharacterized protein LOC126792334 [Argentina anserina]|uniref:uncharacterized protein LOC126792334 n=1 Tax=Argentina anserina TaxID=57926 RepID=UPI00217632E5|nr:uncharacterized protein LOC126792334 [Potentilla anserina]
MGVRFFTLQMIPMCFHVAGNHHVSSRVQLQPDDDEEEFQSPRAKVGGKRAAVGNIKVVKFDGLVKIYSKPVDVSELMREFPKHLVCASDSFYIGQKIPALSEHDQLQFGRKYFLLPKHLFESVLSFVTIASFASSDPESEKSDQRPSPVPSINSKNAFLRKVATCEPFHIQKSDTGCLRIRVSDEFISQLLEEGKLRDEAKVEEDDEHSKGFEPNNKVCTTPQLQKDYSQLVGARQWKPRLEPIRETRETKRRSRLSSFGMRRSKKKSQPNSSSKATQSSKGPKSSKTEHHSKAKTKIKSSKK